MSEYHNIPGPSFTPVTSTYGTDQGEWTAPVVEEILFSTSPYPGIKGCTLAPGQGVLPMGTIIGQRADGKWVPAGAGPPAVAAIGVLEFTVDTGPTGTTGNGPQGNFIYKGQLKNSVIQAAQATDGADLGARIVESMDLFSF